MNTYLREEIQAEQIIRKLQPFRNFLDVSSQNTGSIISYSKIARDIQSDPVSVQSYYQILEDTLVGMKLNPFHKSIRKRQRQNPKFYYFDLGLQSALSRNLDFGVNPKSWGYGRAFEQFVILEIVRLSQYFKKDWKFSYLLTRDNVKID